MASPIIVLSKPCLYRLRCYAVFVTNQFNHNNEDIFMDLRQKAKKKINFALVFLKAFIMILVLQQPLTVWLCRAFNITIADSI